jgi:hypothetical protein
MPADPDRGVGALIRTAAGPRAPSCAGMAPGLHHPAGRKDAKFRRNDPALVKLLSNLWSTGTARPRFRLVRA